MKVTITQNSMGHLTIRPTERAHRKAYRDHLAAQGQRRESSAYIQQDTDVESVLADLSPSDREAVEEGWDTEVEMDPHTFGSYLGYDACEVQLPVA